MLKDQKIILLILSFALLSIFGNKATLASSADIYYPTNGWRTSTPDEQALNSAHLGDMSCLIGEANIAIDSLLIVRNGYLAYESYYPYYDYTDIHQLFSTTKSLTSILIGIANRTGFITNLDERIVEVFSERNFANLDDRKRNITIRHLLRMECGLAWPEWSVPYINSPIDPADYDVIANYTDSSFDNWDFNPDNIVVQMAMSDDWIQFILDQPMESAPGVKFNYNTGASHLLSVILQEKTVMTTVQFAKKYLFDPLNITEYSWGNDSLGYAIGGYGLWLTPRYMAKIGYLFLQNGTWGNQRILTEEWIYKSTKTHHTVNYRSGYGYQLWTDLPTNAYYASGFGGQMIFMKPDQHLIIVVTASEFNSNWPQRLIHEYILRSIKSAPFIESEPSKSTIGYDFIISILSLSMVALVLLKSSS
ncbi:MAG: serine hydrolase domain-containing protein [Candidatus Hodarchaeota archaeon]